jgi:hypothetical protein
LDRGQGTCLRIRLRDGRRDRSSMAVVEDGIGTEIKLGQLTCAGPCQPDGHKTKDQQWNKRDACGEKQSSTSPWICGHFRAYPVEAAVDGNGFLQLDRWRASGSFGQTLPLASATRLYARTNESAAARSPGALRRVETSKGLHWHLEAALGDTR